MINGYFLIKAGKLALNRHASPWILAGSAETGAEDAEIL
jgi:hypothetical protein